MLDRLFEMLAQCALAQPASFVHRDYHSRNLAGDACQQSGHLGFSGRGVGTRNLRSGIAAQGLLRRLAARRGCARGPCNTATGCWRRDLPLDATEAEFIHAFDLMGLQRHIKVLGIFARLYYRDGKVQYLKDLPRVLAYARDAAAQYSETAEFADFIAKRIDP